MDPSYSVEQTNYLDPPLYGIGKRGNLGFLGRSRRVLEQPGLLIWDIFNIRLVLFFICMTKLGWSTGAAKQPGHLILDILLYKVGLYFTILGWSGLIIIRYKL